MVNVGDIFKEGSKGKSLYRILTNRELSKVKLKGDTLDLGSGSESASYMRYLDFREPYSVTYTDYYKAGGNIIKLDLEKPFKLDREYDNITCMGALEHVYDFRNAIRESYRYLKPGGLFVGVTPFIFEYHPCPNDFFRYTHEALRRMFTEEGFKTVRIKGVGRGPFTCSRWVNAVPNILRPFAYLSVMAMDKLVSRRSDGGKYQYPIAYVFVFRKPKKG